ncbi:hypothetical protein [uncultured Methylobacterium sp.]|uniref:hypothetical protein n=1 Tax=uncultured Methylobacterium sp. TaxID=157278 RepID=UPI002597927C|nr:hypothetical protein [uncultured Methylobacterium sp.]
MAESLKDKLLRQEPLLPLIEEAIDRYRRGSEEPVRHPTDDQAFIVAFDEALATLTVTHNGRVVYRSRHAKSSDR